MSFTRARLSNNRYTARGNLSNDAIFEQVAPRRRRFRENRVWNETCRPRRSVYGRYAVVTSTFGAKIFDTGRKTCSESNINQDCPTKIEATERFVLSGWSLTFNLEITLTPTPKPGIFTVCIPWEASCIRWRPLGYSPGHRTPDVDVQVALIIGEQETQHNARYHVMFAKLDEEEANSLSWCLPLSHGYWVIQRPRHVWSFAANQISWHNVAKNSNIKLDTKLKAWTKKKTEKKRRKQRQNTNTQTKRKKGLRLKANVAKISRLKKCARPELLIKDKVQYYQDIFVIIAHQHVCPEISIQ